MLALSICGLALGAVGVLPTPAWQTVTAAAYHCPVELRQVPDVAVPLHLQRAAGVPSRDWRVLDAAQLGAAGPGDALLLPPDPWQVMIHPGLWRGLTTARASGRILLLQLDTLATSGALATTYLGMGLTPAGAYLRGDAGELVNAPAGTYLAAQVGGVPLLPRVAQLGVRTVVPYFETDGLGERATPRAPRTTLKVSPALSWSFAGTSFDSRQPPSLTQHFLSLVMVPAWAIGKVLNAALPSLVYAFSDLLSWLVLGLLLLTAALLVTSGTLGRR